MRRTAPRAAKPDSSRKAAGGTGITAAVASWPSSWWAIATLWVSAVSRRSAGRTSTRWATVLPPSDYTIPLMKMSDAGMQINAVLMVLNLLPIPPLDGGRIAVSLLPHRLAWRFARLEPYGFPVLLLMLFTGVLGAILWPLIAAFRLFLAAIFSF